MDDGRSERWPLPVRWTQRVPDGQTSAAGSSEYVSDEDPLPSLTQTATSKRVAEELPSGRASRRRLVPDGHSWGFSESDTFRQLKHSQQAIVRKVVDFLDTERDSVVITDPLQPSSPIVYVTNAWQQMCGYTSREAIGKNPRLTQGSGTSLDTVRSMSVALRQEQACKVRLINYRGDSQEPFWNCLSVQPIFLDRKLVLFAARLQDYSLPLTKIISCNPMQFCKTNECFQYRLRLSSLSGVKGLSMPRLLHVSQDELDLSTAELEEDGEMLASKDLPLDDMLESPPPIPARHIKRLGFKGLELEPEYLMDRLRHECEELDLRAVSQSVDGTGSDIMRLDVSGRPPRESNSEDNVVSDGPVRLAIHIVPDNWEGSYSVSILRLSGDTFAIHGIYRAIRERLHDILIDTTSTTPRQLAGSTSSTSSLPMARLPVTQQQSLS